MQDPGRFTLRANEEPASERSRSACAPIRRRRRSPRHLLHPCRIPMRRARRTRRRWRLRCRARHSPRRALRQLRTAIPFRAWSREASSPRPRLPYNRTENRQRASREHRRASLPCRRRRRIAEPRPRSLLGRLPLATKRGPQPGAASRRRVRPWSSTRPRRTTPPSPSASARRVGSSARSSSAPTASSLRSRSEDRAGTRGWIARRRPHCGSGGSFLRGETDGRRPVAWNTP